MRKETIELTCDHCGKDIYDDDEGKDDDVKDFSIYLNREELYKFQLCPLHYKEFNRILRKMLSAYLAKNWGEIRVKK